MPHSNPPRQPDSPDLNPGAAPIASHAESLPLEYERDLHKIDQLVREAVQVEASSDLAARVIAASTPDLPAPAVLTLADAPARGRRRLVGSIWSNLAVAASLALVATVGWWTVNQSSMNSPADAVVDATPTDRLDVDAELASWEMTLGGGVEHDAAFEMQALGTLADDESVCPPCFEVELVGLVTDLRH